MIHSKSILIQTFSANNYATSFLFIQQAPGSHSLSDTGNYSAVDNKLVYSFHTNPPQKHKCASIILLIIIINLLNYEKGKKKVITVSPSPKGGA